MNYLLPKTLAALTLSSLVTLTNAAEITLELAEPLTTIKAGDTFNVNVLASDFTSPVDAGGFDLLIEDNTISINKVELAKPFVNYSPIKPTITESEASDIFFFAPIGQSQTGNFTLASIELIANKAGESLLSLNTSLMNPFASLGKPVQVNALSTAITVETPLPGAFWMMFSGLFALSSKRFIK